MDEVVEPPPTAARRGRGSSAWLLEVLGGVLLVGLVGLVVKIRR